MSSHKANKSVAIGGMLVAISVVAIVFFVNSRHDDAGVKAVTPQLAAVVAPAAKAEPEPAPAADDFASSPARAPASTPPPAAATGSPVASIASKPGAPAGAPKTAPTHVVIHEVPVSEPMRRAPEFASAPSPLASPEVIESAPPSVRADPMPVATVEAGAIDDAAVDRRITAGVKVAMDADSQLSSLNIGVTSLHGNVTLSGHLATQDAIDHARDVARTVQGVLSVDTSGMVVASL